MRITDIREQTVPIASPIANAYIDFSKMDVSVVAVVTDVERDGRPVVGYGFNSNGRYGQGALLRDRFIPRLLDADPRSLIDDAGDNLDPHPHLGHADDRRETGRARRALGRGRRIDMAVWDAVAKIEGKPLYRLLADRYRVARPTTAVWVYAAGRLLPARQGPARAPGRDARLSRPGLRRSSR